MLQDNPPAPPVPSHATEAFCSAASEPSPGTKVQVVGEREHASEHR